MKISEFKKKNKNTSIGNFFLYILIKKKLKNLNIEYTIFNLKKYWPKLLLEKFNMRIYTCAYMYMHA